MRNGKLVDNGQLSIELPSASADGAINHSIGFSQICFLSIFYSAKKCLAKAEILIFALRWLKPTAIQKNI